MTAGKPGRSRDGVPRAKPGKYLSAAAQPPKAPEAASRARDCVPNTRSKGSAPATTRIAGTVSEGSVQKIRVLIVDDHQMFREALRRMLQIEPDIEVAGEASRGSEVARLVLRVPADVLLLDMHMPGGSGLEALRSLSAQGANIRTILLTGTADREQVVEAIRLGARGVVLKDAPPELLVRAIQQVAQGQYWVGHERIADLIATVNENASKAAQRPADTLTRRELQIVSAIAQGASNKEIGAQLALSEQTVKNHLSSIFDKLGVSNRLELALYAMNHRLLDRDRS